MIAATGIFLVDISLYGNRNVLRTDNRNEFKSVNFKSLIKNPIK